MSRLNTRTLERIESVARELAEPLGLDIVRVDYQRQDAGWFLTVVVNREGGVRISDCEKLTRPLSRKLDQLDLIPDRYFLEVSSPGISVEPPGGEEEPG